jgi:putative inorganic carbon (hco3(-)) transporter
MQRSLEISFPSSRPLFRREQSVVSTDGPKFAFGLLIVFLLMMYSSISVLYPQVNVLRPVLVVAMGAIGMLILELAQTRQHFRATWPQSFILPAFLGVAVVSTFSAIYVKKAFETTLDFSKIILIYFVIENTVTTESRLKKIFTTLVIGGLFPAIGTIHHYMNGILIEGSRGSWVGVFKNPNEDAYCLAILVPFAVVLFQNARWHWRIVLLGVIATYLVAIFVTFSRGSLIGLIAGLGLIGWKQKSFVLRIAMIVFLVAGIAVAGAFWARSKSFDSVQKDTTFRQRIATVMAGGLMFMDHPLLGVGPGCSMFAYGLYVPKEYLDCGCETQLVIHNSFLQVLAETGFMGFLLFMGLLIISYFDARRMQSGPLAKYATGLEIGLVIFAVCSLAGGFIYTWSPYIIFGLVVAAKRIASSEPAEGSQTA